MDDTDLIKILYVLCAFAVMIGCSVEHRAKSVETPDVPLTSNIQQLISQLGSDDWQTREAAQKQLEDWPTERLNQIEPAMKSAAEGKDPEIKNRANTILKVITVKKRVKFSESFLKEFPDIYRNLAVLDTQGKFILLSKVTERDKGGVCKYKDIITNQDLAGLISEILLENIEELTKGQKYIVLAISKGEFSGYQGADGTADDIFGGWYQLVPESASCIIKLLKDNDSLIRTQATNALSILSAREAIPEITKLLKDEDIWVRREAIISLGRLGVREIIPELINLLKDENEWIRNEAAFTLGKLGIREAIPEITKLLKANWPIYRMRSAFALGELGAKEIIPELTELLKDEDKHIRGCAAIALVELGAKGKVPKEVIPNVKSILEWGGDYANRARAALKELGVEVEEKEEKK